MHARNPATDASSPSPGADLVLVAALLGVLTGLAWGVIWVQNAWTADATPSIAMGLIPPAAAAVCGGALRAVRGAYDELPRLRRFVTRMSVLGLAGAVLLALLVAIVSPA